MRDPDGKQEWYSEHEEYLVHRLSRSFKNEEYSDEVLVNINLCTFEDVVEYMKCLYANGKSLAAILDYFDKTGWPHYKRSAEFIRSLSP